MNKQLDTVISILKNGYQSFLVSMVNALFAVFERPNGFTSQGLRDLETSLGNRLSAQSHYFETYIKAYTSIAREAGINKAISLGAKPLDTGVMNELQALVAEAQTELVGEIALMMTKDTLSIKKAWRSFAIDSKFMARVPTGYEPILARAGKIEGLRFRQFDKMGRQWDSARAAITAIRLHLLRVEVESCLYTLKLSGFDVVTASWADGRQSIDFSISGSSEYVGSYMEIRDALFHPNSTAEISNATAA
jgi:hypothetical protein